MFCEVRELDDDEIDEVIPLIKKLFPKASFDFTGDDLFFVATVEDELVGFMHLVEKDEYFVLQGLGVDEEYRGLGAGSALMDKLEQVSDSTSKKIFLKVKSLNPAVRLYENHGFTVKKFGTVHTLEKNVHN